MKHKNVVCASEPGPDDQAIRRQARKLLDQHGEAFALGTAQGRDLDLPGALSLATAAGRAPA